MIDLNTPSFQNLLIIFASYAELRHPDKSLTQLAEELESYGNNLFTNYEVNILIGFAHFLSVERDKINPQLTYLPIATSVKSYPINLIGGCSVIVNTTLTEEEATLQIKNRVDKFIRKEGMEGVNQLQLLNCPVLWLTNFNTCFTYVEDRSKADLNSLLRGLGIIRV